MTPTSLGSLRRLCGTLVGETASSRRSRPAPERALRSSVVLPWGRPRTTVRQSSASSGSTFRRCLASPVWGPWHSSDASSPTSPWSSPTPWAGNQPTARPGKEAVRRARALEPLLPTAYLRRRRRRGCLRIGNLRRQVGRGQGRRVDRVGSSDRSQAPLGVHDESRCSARAVRPGARARWQGRQSRRAHGRRHLRGRRLSRRHLRALLWQRRLERIYGAGLMNLCWRVRLWKRRLERI
mmetsp:Transcript_60788/g.137272  ORF Transcript_60788/g.137272 Transcript_60788/m.137272 type:complete len:238 (-) Transcript_60788:407-1120(-)